MGAAVKLGLLSASFSFSSLYFSMYYLTADSMNWGLRGFQMVEMVHLDSKSALKLSAESPS